MANQIPRWEKTGDFLHLDPQSAQADPFEVLYFNDLVTACYMLWNIWMTDIMHITTLTCLYVSFRVADTIGSFFICATDEIQCLLQSGSTFSDWFSIFLVSQGGGSCWA